MQRRQRRWRRPERQAVICRASLRGFVPTAGPSIIANLLVFADSPGDAVRLDDRLAQRGLDPAVTHADVVGIVATVGADVIVARALHRTAQSLGIGLALAIPDRGRAHLGAG